MAFPAMSDAARVAAIREDLQRIAALPADAPEGPPGRFYTDPAYFEHECATVLRTGWHCLGRADEIPGEGDYFTTQILNEPLIVVRTEGEVRVLSNVCRHRGMPVAEGAGTAKRFICSYHAWTYALDGELKRAARMENAGFDMKTCGLPQFPCVEKMGFIYVSLSDAPPDLEAELAGLDGLVGAYEPDGFRIIHTAEEVWRTNWKCLVENFMEGYHLSVVHPVTLHGYTPTGLSRKAISGPGFTSYNANYPEAAPARGQGAGGLSDEQRRRSSLYSVFPCQVASQAATLLVSLTILPLEVDKISVRWTMSTYGDDLDEETLEARIRLWEEVNREDREKLEKMQVALGSRHATGGPLAGEDYEGTVRDFHLWLARQDAG